MEDRPYIEKVGASNYSPLKCCDISSLLNKICLETYTHHIFILFFFLVTFPL